MMLNRNYIEKLHVENLRNFDLLNIEFNPGFNFIAGPNGCGKTSVLVCIAHCFNSKNLNYSNVSESSEYWSDFTVDGEKFRIGLGKQSSRRAGYRKGVLNGAGIPFEKEAGRASIYSFDNNRAFQDYHPLFIGAHRSIKYKEIGGMAKEPPADTAASTYLDSNVKSIYGEWSGNIKQWFVNRYFILEKDWAGVERDNFKHLINNLPFIAPFDSDFSFVEIGRDLEPVFSIYGSKCYLEELSSGFQAVLGILATIFEWVEGSRVLSRSVEEATGTVLIDELDLHLHPEWQFTLRKSLVKIFPNLQFIVTTHSPHLLASAAPNEIIIMPARGAEINLGTTNKAFSGWSTDQILSEVMGVRSLDNKLYNELVDKAFDEIERKSVEGLENAIKNLEKVCHPSDTVVTVLKVKLASMVALSND